MATDNKTKNKQMLLAAAGISVVLIIIIFGSSKILGSKNTEAPSSVAIQPNGAAEKTAASEITPSYREELVRHNEQKRAEAETKGTSSLPVLIPSDVERQAPRPRAKEEDKQTAPVANAQQPQPRNPGVQAADQASAAHYEAMRNMANGLLQRPLPTPTSVIAQETKAAAQTQPTASQSTQHAEAIATKVSVDSTPIAKAGEMVYVLMNSDIDTDEPDIAHFTVIQGALKGGRFVGTATRQNEMVKVSVNSFYMNKQAYSVTGQVMDVNTARGLLAGDVDRKLFQRYGLPFLGGFVTGLGAAVAQGNTQITSSAVGTTSTTTPLNNRQIMGSAFGAGASGVTQQIQRSAAKTEPAVRIPGGGAYVVWLFSDIVPKSEGAGAVTAQDKSSAQTQNPSAASDKMLEALLSVARSSAGAQQTPAQIPQPFGYPRVNYPYYYNQ